MTQEDKDLLLEDLCARLPYGVMLSVTHNKYTDETFNARISTIDYCGDIKVRYGFEEYEQVYSLEQIKPYLFPLSSMTEEERIAIGNEFAYGQPHKAMDILHKRHIDYRGLIEKGLANDTTGLNIY